MKLAVFDLDGTLLSVDAGVQWIEYLAKHNGVDMRGEVAQCHQFLADYRAGNFDVEAFMAYHMTILSRFPRQFLLWIRENFLNEIIFPKITSSALGLVSAMKADGYTLVMATGTQRFISAPIADRFGIEHVLATTPLLTPEGEFSGQHLGDYCYGASKIDRLSDFLTSKGEQVENLEHLVFYTDSITDLPLIQFVEKFNGHVVATNPDPRLKELAEKRGWSVIELFAR